MLFLPQYAPKYVSQPGSPTPLWERCLLSGLRAWDNEGGKGTGRTGRKGRGKRGEGKGGGSFNPHCEILLTPLATPLFALPAENLGDVKMSGSSRFTI